MPKSIYVIAFLISWSSYSRAQNLYPTSGNVALGTTAIPTTLTITGGLLTNGIITQSGGTVSSTSGFTNYLKTSTIIPGSSTNLNPGLLVYGDRWFDYGMDVGYNATSGRYRTRIFSPLAADVSLSYLNETGTIPTSQSNFSDGLIMLGGSGNILIGQSSQVNSTYKLDVAGNVRANQVTVNTTGADFVFDSAYHLPDLLTIAAYIQANHHLPQVRSAAEMQKDGLNLGEDQIRLLQKIEELTLYAIKQQSELEALKQQNQRLEERNRAFEDLEKRIERLEHPDKPATKD